MKTMRTLRKEQVMEIGRNIEHDKTPGVFSVVFRWANDKTYRRWNFDTHRKASRKFNQLKKEADWLPIQEDVTI